jgi:trimethylamine--corrinoid protein Co-methyltransferase
MHGSLLGFSLEGVVIDNDVIGAVQRTIKGIEVTDESLSIETMRAQCVHGPGHYLGSPQTLELMQREYIYPGVGDRLSPKEWNEVGRPRLVDVARERVRRILDAHYPDHIPDQVDAHIREYLPIRLPREKMRRPSVDAGSRSSVDRATIS